MAKCPICNSRKAKRKCRADSTVICSLCCGQTRTSDKCTGCSFYKDASSSRNYRKVPFFEIQEMSNSFELQDIANTVESILCTFNLEAEEFTDKSASKLLELAFDKYHFKDLEFLVGNVEQKDWFESLSQTIEQDFPKIPEEQLIKVLASIYRSIQRRTRGGREYLQFTQQYVGARIGPGARILTR
jgi:hypothetical protein